MLAEAWGPRLGQGPTARSDAGVALHEICDSGLVILQRVMAAKLETELQLIVRLVTI